MAKATNSTSTIRLKTVKKKRKGIHSKKKAARSKKSKNYLKKYNGQG